MMNTDTLLDLAARFISQHLKDSAYKRSKWKIQVLRFLNAPIVFAQSETTSVLIACLTTKGGYETFRKKVAETEQTQLIGQARFILSNINVVHNQDVPKGWQLLVALDANTIELPFPYYSIWDRPFVFTKRDRELEVDLFWLYEAKSNCGLAFKFSELEVKLVEAESKIEDEKTYLAILNYYKNYYGLPGKTKQEPNDIIEQYAHLKLEDA